MIHHLAIATTQIEEMEKFYTSIPGLRLIKKYYFDDNSLRSAWFESEEGLIIMIEKENFKKAPLALIFTAKDKNGNWRNIGSYVENSKKRTDFTIYFHDPDENWIGFTTFPENFVYNLFKSS